MKKFLIYTIATLSLPLIFSTCSEDFLDKKKIGEETDATFYTTESNSEMAVTAAYGVLITRHGFARNYWAFGDAASDDSEGAGEQGGRDQPACQKLDQLLIDAGNEYVGQFYGDMYQGIYRCNIAISKIPDAEFNQGKKDRLVAEARFLRAFFHFSLNNVYGGVKIVDHPLVPEEYMGPRNSVAEVLHFIQDEMAEAAAVLPAVYPDEDNGRATKGAALGYQLKALVFESSYAQLAGTDKDPANYFEGCTQKWGQAMTVFNQLEALGVYHLEPDYADIWPVDHEKGPELIWTGHSVSRDAGGGIEDINRQIIGGVQCVYQACRSYYDEDGVLIPNGRSGLYGLNAPTYELRDEFETGDPRRDISFVEEYDPLILSIDGVLDTLPAAPSFASPTSMNNAKYDPLPWEWISSVLHYGPRDIKFMRYADVLLLAAEAALNNNDAGTALTLVNRVRTRARNSGTTAAPADLSSVTMADIQHERRCELALEAHRYFDIVRWGIADDVLSGQYRQTDLMTNPDAAPLDWIPGKHEFFPIPESEIALNQGQMAQNPGY